MSHVSCRDIAFAYGPETVLKGFSLEVAQGEARALFGPSGCGKTTVLRLIAGLERPHDGEIHLRQVQVAGPGAFVAPQKRHTALVFQDLALWPHLSVRAHLDVVLRAAGLDRSLRTNRRDAVLESLDLGGYAGRRPPELSGGQQQRLAIARALVAEPDILLLDEPLAGLDDALRSRCLELFQARRAAGAAIILATHDQSEIAGLCDAVLEMGDQS